MQSSHTKKTTTLTILVLGILFILSIIFLTDYSPLKNNIDTLSIEDKYGIELNLPDGWVVEDCSPESKRYPKEFRYICKWSSLPHPESGERTSVYLFATDKNIELSPEDIDAFVRERQEYGWAGEVARDPSISVTFDETINPVSYGKWNGVQTDDYVEHKEFGAWYMWTSTFVPITTSQTNVILEINHIDENIFADDVFYTVEDVLKRITILNEDEIR